MELKVPPSVPVLDWHTICPCIYQIVNRHTEDRYIGSTFRPLERKRKHERQIGDGSHTNPILVRAFAKYGSDAFIFEIVEWFEPTSITREQLFAVEQGYLDLVKPVYNISTDATYNTMSEEGKARRERQISKEWIVTPPEGVEHHVMNLRRFCREQRLVQAHLWYVAQGKASHSKGWRCRYADGSTPTYINKAAGNYAVTFPDGHVEHVCNLSAFCKQYALAYTGMMNVLTGSQTQHKGYRVQKATA